MKNRLFISILFFLFPMIFLTELMGMAEKETINAVVKVGVVLDFDTSLGKMGISCISMALSDFYASHGHYNTRILLRIRDSKTDVVAAAAAALDLLQNEEVEAIIGPGLSKQANFLIGLGSKAQVPIISFSATSPSLSSLRSQYFVRATLNDSAQVPVIRAIVQAFGWRQVVLIYADTEYGNGVIPSLTSALQEVDTHVTHRSPVHPWATDDQIVQELYKLTTMSTRVFIVHMNSRLGRRLFTKAKEVGMMEEGYVWILTDGMTDFLTSLSPLEIDSMQGVLGVKPHVPRTKELKRFEIRWKRKIQEEYPRNEISYDQLNVFGLWAYDAASALAMAVEKLPGNFSFRRTNISGHSTGLENIRVSPAGPGLLRSLLSTRFPGLSGDFQIVDGQLRPPDFEIVNVIGKGERGVGFWTAEKGIVGGLSSNSKASLKAIIWPGESTSVPKGWVFPTKGEKLKIGVPVKKGFSEFVKVTRDPITNRTKVTGYSIAIFNAVMAKLPYAVLYEYVPFQTPDGKAAGNYDELVSQVYFQKFDAVVGDVTILANRSLFVDFTLPYTESGVSMIVPIIDNRSKSAWVFLNPLTWDLWLTSACFFVFIGFVIWTLEHRINEDFRGPPSHQVGTILWFSFSTLVFAQRERIMSNLARFVVTIWFFVVLILTQSYTASLTSMLTVQQLKPAITDINEIIRTGQRVGYQNGSFIFTFLKQMKFHESNLVIYNSPEHLDELFKKGSRKGGIAAAFDEIPYMKLFLAKYCYKYTAVQPTYKFEGFGFVFPKHSPFVSDVSMKILNVTEGDQMAKIEQAWFRQNSSCSELESSISSYKMGLDSFWGLFLIAGGASSAALIACMASFLYEHRDTLKHLDPPPASVLRTIKALATRFDNKDVRFHTFRQRISSSSSDSINDADADAVTASPSPATISPPTPSPATNSPPTPSPATNGPPTPSSLSVQTESSNFAFSGDQAAPAAFQGSDPMSPGEPTHDTDFEIRFANSNHHQSNGST